MSKKNVVFLFGAGASVPAGCKTTERISVELIGALKKDSLIAKEFSWIFPLWEILKSYSFGFQEKEEVDLPSGEKISFKKFEPNFEQLIYLIELLDIYMNVGITLPKDLINNPKSVSLIQEITKNFNRTDILQPAIFYILTELQPLTRAAVFQVQNPPFAIKGTVDFELAKNALIQAVTKGFPKEYNLSHLTGFREVLSHNEFTSVIATTNYDLVFEAYFKKELLGYQDGFSNEYSPSVWEGFAGEGNNIKYLKLHGSLTWFRLSENLFELPPSSPSSNNIYKIVSGDTTGLLKEEIRNKIFLKEKWKYQFNTPHIIVGGGKDSKISDNPFIEIYREWQNSIAGLHTLVIVGLSASDIHLINQMRSLLCNNNRFEKVIIINPDRNALQTFKVLFTGIRGRNEIPYIFDVQSNWNVEELNKVLKMSLLEMIVLSASQLQKHFSNLNKN